MWGPSLRWGTLVEDQDGAEGNILSSGERETKTFFLRNYISFVSAQGSTPRPADLELESLLLNLQFGKGCPRSTQHQLEQAK